MDKPLELFIFIDALGWQLAQEHRFLEDLLPHRQKVTMQFGYSCTALPTILSGKKPVEHGHLSFFYYDPAKSPFKLFRILKHVLKPASLWNRGRVRHQLSKLFRAIYGYTGYFQLYAVPFDRLPYFNYCEKKNIFGPEGLAPVPNLFDLLLRSGLQFHITDWRLPEAQNFALAGDAAARRDMNVIFLYTASLDSLLHQHVGDPEVIQQKLDYFEVNIRKLVQVARSHHQQCRVTVLSDHGMTPLRGVFDAKAQIEETQLVFGQDYSACYDATMARFWFHRPGAEEPIRKAMAKAPGHWLSEGEKRRYGIDFPDHKYGQAIHLLAPGWQIEPSDMGNKALNGMHGYTPEDPLSDASLLSDHPVDDCPVQEVADLFTLMKKRIQDIRLDALENITL
jgi:hypothetical protein